MSHSTSSSHTIRGSVGRPSQILDRARLFKAQRLIAVYEEDSTNVEIAVSACALSRASRPSTAPPLDCHAQVSDVDLRDSLRRHHLPVQDGRCRVHFFDFFDDAAREVLLEQLPLDHDGVGEADPRQVHLVIVGLGARFGVPLLRQYRAIQELNQAGGIVDLRRNGAELEVVAVYLSRVEGNRATDETLLQLAVIAERLRERAGLLS